MNKKILTIVALLALSPMSVTTSADEKALNPEKTVEATFGVSVVSLPEMLKSHLPKSVDRGRGVLVAEIAPGSPAEKAGLRQHDVLIRYGDQDLYSPEQLFAQVRSDEPGKEIEVQFARSGEVQRVRVKLGPQESSFVSKGKWNSTFSNGFNIPWLLLRPEYWTEAQDDETGGTEWTSFESLSVQKESDGSYLVRIVYKSGNGNSVGKEFKGTRQEIRDAISADNDLPESRKNQLMRTLDDRGRRPLRQSVLDRWDAGSFDWLNLNF